MKQNEKYVSYYVKYAVYAIQISMQNMQTKYAKQICKICKQYAGFHDIAQYCMQNAKICNMHDMHYLQTSFPICIIFTTHFADGICNFASRKPREPEISGLAVRHKKHAILNCS